MRMEEVEEASQQEEVEEVIQQVCFSKKLGNKKPIQEVGQDLGDPAAEDEVGQDPDTTAKDEDLEDDAAEPQVSESVLGALPRLCLDKCRAPNLGGARIERLFAARGADFSSDTNCEVFQPFIDEVLKHCDAVQTEFSHEELFEATVTPHDYVL